jgi:hypothetical protein
MRLTLILLLLAVLAGCTARPHAMTPPLDTAFSPAAFAGEPPAALDRPARAQDRPLGPPAPETLRTEPDLPEEKKRPRQPAFGHFRLDFQGGVFLDDDVDDFYESTWGLGVSGGLFLNEHVSIGGMLDFNAADEELDFIFNNQKVGTEDYTLSVFTISPMIWLHLVGAAEVKNDLSPSVAVGAGPSLVFAHEEVEVDTILGDFDEDDDDTGWGFQVEVVGEVPIGRQLTVVGGARYAMKRMDDFKDLDVIMGFLGLGVRF